MFFLRKDKSFEEEKMLIRTQIWKSKRIMHFSLWLFKNGNGILWKTEKNWWSDVFSHDEQSRVDLRGGDQPLPTDKGRESPPWIMKIAFSIIHYAIQNSSDFPYRRVSLTSCTFHWHMVRFPSHKYPSLGTIL